MIKKFAVSLQMWLTLFCDCENNNKFGNRKNANISHLNMERHVKIRWEKAVCCSNNIMQQWINISNMWLNTLKWTSWVRISKMTLCYFLNTLFFPLNFRLFGAKSFEIGQWVLKICSFYWWHHNRQWNVDFEKKKGS